MPKKTSKLKNRGPTGPVRDPEATRARLIAAVGSLLARKGFQALGVNAVAREAGVDKVLIYRYFGGLQELIGAYGREGDFWPTVKEMAGGDVERFAGLPLEKRLGELGRNFIRAVRGRPITQEIMAWEMVERNNLTVVLEAVREARMMQLWDRCFGDVPEHPLDLGAITAVIGAGISYLATRSRNVQWYNGVDLQSDRGWRRLEDAISWISRSAAEN